MERERKLAQSVIYYTFFLRVILAIAGPNCKETPQNINNDGNKPMLRQSALTFLLP